VSSLVVAYSGRVDSAYLAYAAHQVLPERGLVREPSFYPGCSAL
jgi:PP-loop superfamily ATP-utilizing enzyme